MTTSRQIMIVDGATESRRDLARDLARHGYGVVQISTAADTYSRILFLADRIDLLIIDTNLPDGHGTELVRRLRSRGVSIPIMLVSSACGEDDVVSGLDAGADDYVPRPLRPREFAARVRAQFRVVVTPDAGDIRIGPIVYRPGTRTVHCASQGRSTKLTDKEAALLLRLCSAEGRPVSRQTLLREVWGYSPTVSSHTVETHIYRLRRKIEPGQGAPELLVNEEGGYRLCHNPTRDLPAPSPGALADWVHARNGTRVLEDAMAAE